MKNLLTNATKKRIIYEVKKIFESHPKYKNDSVNVQNKFSYDEKPQRGLIVNSTSADRVRLSADNYIGRLTSFCMLTSINEKPGTSIEWVRENYPLLEHYDRRRTIFPSPPGSYIITVTQLPDEGRGIPGKFTVEPVLEVKSEDVSIFGQRGSEVGQLQRDNIYKDSLRLWLNGKRAILRGVDYDYEEETGSISFLKRIPDGCRILADYHYALPIQGPFPLQPEQDNDFVIPGAVIAFGDKLQLNDQQCLVVSEFRDDAYEIYGGKFDVNFELIAFSRDAEDREKLSDYIVVKMLEVQNTLGFEGLELLDISPSGENEDVYIEAEESYYYQSTINVGMRVDWESYYPLPVKLWRNEFTSRKAEQETGYIEGTYPLDNIKVVQNASFIKLGRTYDRVT